MSLSNRVLRLAILFTFASSGAEAVSNGVMHTVGSNKEILAQEWGMSARLAQRSLLLDIAGIDDQLVAVGQRGHVLISHDGGIECVDRELGDAAGGSVPSAHVGDRGS